MTRNVFYGPYIFLREGLLKHSFKTHVKYQFELPAHYDLFGTMRFGRFGKWDPAQTLTEDRFVKVTRLAGAICVIEARRLGQLLSVEVLSEEEVFSRQSMLRFFGLHCPPLRVSGHPTLERLSRQMTGLHLGVSVSLGYDMIRTVFQQLIEWRDAARIWRQWLLRDGTPLDDYGLHCPPSFRDIRGQSLDRLHRCGLSRKRAGVVRELARFGDRLDGWNHLDDTTLKRRLKAIRGIGDWTAEHCLGFSLNQPDIVITGDYQLPHTVAWVLAGEARANDSRMLTLLEPWKGHRWSVLRLIFASDIRAPRRGPRLNKGRASRPR